MFGFSESEQINLERFLETIDEEDRARIEERVQASLASGGEYESEYRIIQPGGRTLWVAGYGRTEVDERGKPVLMRGMTRDITKRKMAEEALLESDARFRAVADAAPVMIWMSGPDKLCNFFNKGWLDFTGRTLAQELGNGWTEGVHREDLAHCLEVYKNAFDAREPFTMEYRLRRKDGEYRWILDSGTARTDLNGVFLGYIGSCVDITERRQAELDSSATKHGAGAGGTGCFDGRTGGITRARGKQSGWRDGGKRQRRATVDRPRQCRGRRVE